MCECVGACLPLSHSLSLSICGLLQVAGSGSAPIARSIQRMLHSRGTLPECTAFMQRPFRRIAIWIYIYIYTSLYTSTFFSSSTHSIILLYLSLDLLMSTDAGQECFGCDAKIREHRYIMGPTFCWARSHSSFCPCKTSFRSISSPLFLGKFATIMWNQVRAHLQATAMPVVEKICKNN